jgi:hypothetical protein
MTSVLVATLTAPDGQNATSFTECLLRAVMYDATKDGMFISGGGPMFLPASPNTLSKMRNNAALYVLDESEAEWLLFIDSDMGFDEDAPYRLLEAADPVERPVVGALCFGMFKHKTDERGGWFTKPFPTLYDWKADEDGSAGFKLRYDFTPGVVTQVAATGAAFLLIHRSALEKVREQAGDTWFDRAKMRPEEELMGEDISFCARLGAAGIPLFVHTGVDTTHLKPVWVDQQYYWDQRALHTLRGEEVPAHAAG